MDRRMTFDPIFNKISWRQLYLSQAKLKASSKTSTLLAGFAMVALVDLDLKQEQGEEGVSTALLLTFAICTILLVSVHMLALLISTCVLPNVESISQMNGTIPVGESPHRKLAVYIEIAWIFSTIVGALLFMIEVALICWIKFSVLGPKGTFVALTSTLVLLPILLISIFFALRFYRKLLSYQYKHRQKGLEKLDKLADKLKGSNTADPHAEFNRLHTISEMQRSPSTPNINVSPPGSVVFTV